MEVHSGSVERFCSSRVFPLTLGDERIKLLEEGRNVNDDTVADKGRAVRVDETWQERNGGCQLPPVRLHRRRPATPERTTREQVKVELCLFAVDRGDNGVAGVVSTGAPGADVDLAGEDVD